MLDLIRSGNVDIVVGSRYAAGGSLGKWDQRRARISAIATRLARLIAKSDLTDPMSGFFIITREAFNSSVHQLSSQGYKILLDICASAQRPLRIRELPYQFRSRQAGESKLDALVVWEYLMLLADKLVGHVLPVRFLSFILIGGLGVLVHMTVLALLITIGLSTFLIAQAVATILAMIFNFFVNNILTYRDRRLRGVRAVAVGLLTFMAACSIGALTNVGIANFLFSDQKLVWWSAGLAGVFVGAVWNYAATSIVTWRVR